MVGWKLIGFPGARYDYRDHVDKHGEHISAAAGRPQGPAGLDPDRGLEADGDACCPRRRGADRLRLDRRDRRPGARCDAGLQVLALERGRWRDTPTDFAVDLRAGRAALHWRHDAVPGAGARDVTFRNNVQPDRAADAPTRLVPARHRRRRRRRPLERPDLALSAHRLPDPQPQPAALRQAGACPPT